MTLDWQPISDPFHGYGQVFALVIYEMEYKGLITEEQGEAACKRVDELANALFSGKGLKSEPGKMVEIVDDPERPEVLEVGDK